MPTFVNVLVSDQASCVGSAASVSEKFAGPEKALMPPTCQEELVHSRRAEGVCLNQLALPPWLITIYVEYGLMGSVN